MNLYLFVVSLHVTVAILGLGPLMALALFTKRPALPAGETRPMPPETALSAWLRLLRVSQISLGLMFATGATLIVLVHGAFGRQMWMITSVALFVLLGAGAGLAQSFLKKALKPTGSIVHIERAHRSLVAMGIILVLIVWLMESKPF